MKYGLLIWNILLTIIAGYLLVNQFNSKKAAVTVTQDSPDDSVVAKGACRIAYFEMDSIENNFQIVKDIKAEMTKKEDDNNAELNKLGKTLQDRYGYYQHQEQAGNLTQAQKEAASMELKNMDEGIRNRKQQLDQDYNEFVTRKMKDIKSKIEDFLKEYNKARNYSYIIVYEPGLFYYKDTLYNITADVIKGLNEKYSDKKK